MRRQATGWEKIFIKDISDRRLLPQKCLSTSIQVNG
jgi:hypothetical protein